MAWRTLRLPLQTHDRGKCVLRKTFYLLFHGHEFAEVNVKSAMPSGTMLFS